jgi:hypothetical protein
MLATIFLLATGFTTQELDSDQFMRLMSGALAPLKDEAFIYEGEARFVGPREMFKGDPDVPLSSYQGSFAARSDGSVFIDTYRRNADPFGPLQRETGYVFGDHTERFRRMPDSKEAKPDYHARRVPRALLSTGSPLRLTYTWAFRDSDAAQFAHLKSHGMEKIDGQECLHIECDGFPGLKPDSPMRSHYWVDIGRGGHMTRVEHRNVGDLISRATISLARVESEEGKTLWYPTKCRFEAFNYNGQQSDKAFVEETVLVVPSSIRLNSGLPDSVFSLSSSGGVADTSGLALLRDEFRHPRPTPRERTDIKSVEAQLEKDLAAAERQARALDASRDPAEGDSGVWIARGLWCFGALALCIAGGWWWRRR